MRAPFEKAFSEARTKRVETFFFRGGDYTTQLDTETEEEWQAFLKRRRRDKSKATRNASKRVSTLQGSRRLPHRL